MEQSLRLKVAPWIRKAYKELVKEADNAFENFAKKYKGIIKCGPKCVECCHAVFGLFPLEGVLIHEAYLGLMDEIKKEVSRRASKALDSLRLLSNLNQISGKAVSQRLSRIRIRCPFLGDDDLCAVYPRRPITCRVYGIPISTMGTIKVCPYSTSEELRHLTAFDMDGAHKKLFELSSFFLKDNRIFDLEKPRLMISVSYAILKPYDVLIDSSLLEGYCES